MKGRMAVKMRSVFVTVFLIVAGYVIGGAIATLTKNIGLLSWLSYGTSIGLNADKPATLDLAFIKVVLGFAMTLNIAEVVGIIGAVVLGRRMGL